MSFQPEWGETGSDGQHLWDGGFASSTGLGGSATSALGGATPYALSGIGTDPLAGTSAATRQNRLRYALELRYGIPVLKTQDLLTLFARSDLQNAATNIGMGADFKLGKHFSTGYEAALQSGATQTDLGKETDHRAYIRYQRGF